MAACGKLLGTRLVIEHADGNIVWKRVPHACGKPARFEGSDGVRRCWQHDRMVRGLPGGGTNAATSAEPAL